VATRAASKEVIEKLVEATLAFDTEGMAYGLQQATALQLHDNPEVVEAAKVLKQVTVAKTALKSALESALLDDLQLALALARQYPFLAEDVARAEAMAQAICDVDKVRTEREEEREREREREKRERERVRESERKEY
jgi:hypothetical protein